MIKIAPSSIERYEACPGAYYAEDGLPWQDSPWAAEGTLLHAAVSDESKWDGLTTEQRRVVAICRNAGRELLVEHVKGNNQFAHESYLQWTAARFKLSGKLDFVAWDEEAALIIDWKFGRELVEVAPSNLQLRCYAVLMDINYPRERLVVAIVQPYAEPERRLTLCGYNRKDLDQATSEIVEIAKRIENGRDNRVVGPQCKYCKAAGTQRCPESLKNTESLVQIETAPMPVGDELATLLDRVKAAEPVIDAIKQHAVAEIQAGRDVPGWRIGKTQVIRTLPDAAMAWEQAQTVIPPDKFTEACKVSVTALQDVMAEHCGWPSKVAKDEFNRIMGPAIVAGERRGSLERVK